MNKFEEAMQSAIEKAKHTATFERPPKGQYAIGEFISAVFSIENEVDAEKFYEGYIKDIISHWDKVNERNPRKLTPEQVAQSNIGWCFGEGMPQEKIAMWVKVCGATHPVFGTIMPTPEETFKKGQQAGKAMKGEAAGC